MFQFSIRTFESTTISDYASTPNDAESCLIQVEVTNL